MHELFKALIRTSLVRAELAPVLTCKSISVVIFLQLLDLTMMGACPK
jgi:hypothetical protein